MGPRDHKNNTLSLLAENFRRFEFRTKTCKQKKIATEKGAGPKGA